MDIGRSSNPALNQKTFDDFKYAATADETMTLQGTINKIFLLIFLVMGGAAVTWYMAIKGVQAGNGTPVVIPVMIAGLIGGLITCLITVFKKEWAGITAPIYAVLEGLFLGAISAFFEVMYPGIAVQAVALTFGTLLALLFIYKSGWIKVTDNFRMGVFAATGAIGIVYLASWIMSMFHIPIGFIHSNGIMGIGFSLVVVVIASMNLVLDFDFIEKGSESGAPKYMEWYAAFGLMVTLIWLYIEILKLLSKLRRK